MSIVLAIDCETTGRDIANDRIIEIGAVVYDTDQKMPLLIQNWLLWDESYPDLSPDIENITGISLNALKLLHVEPKLAFMSLDCLTKFNIEYVLGHNINRFDIPILKYEFTRQDLTGRNFFNLPTIDTMYDIPYLEEPDSKKLKHLCGEHGFVPFFSHRAVFDALSCLKILSHYKFEDVVALSKEPLIVIKADVSYDDRQLAKDAKFMWEKLYDRTYTKSWIKQIRASKLEEERKKYSFNIKVLE